jgi:L-ribulokinase
MNIMSKQYVIGIDYGSDSVRAVVIDAATGAETAGEVAYYRRWAKGQYCDPVSNRFRQHPLDYIEGLETAVKGALAQLPPEAAQSVIGIGIDTTGSTPCPLDAEGMPLALKPEFAENPNAMFVLWKDHTAVKEAEAINRLAKSWGGVDFTKYEGGIYSSEWFWAKILHVLREDQAVREAAYTWAEHCDWIPALLTGTTDPQKMKRSRCAAGHKAMWHSEWGGLPAEEFLTRLDPLLAGLRSRLFTDTYTADVKAGDLTTEWAERLGLPAGIAVAGGAFDAHMGAVGGGISEGALVKIMGTSTCDIMMAPPEVIGAKQVAGICGQVDGSVVPGLIGLEAGQSAFGDVYAWFRRLMLWPFETMAPQSALLDPALANQLKEEIESKILPKLEEEAGKLGIEDVGLVALDWLNGRRTPDADQSLKGAVIGLSLGTDAPRFYRALVEATAFGAKAIVDRFRSEGVTINQVIALGGIAKKSDFVMQVTADVFDMPIKVVESLQACALGAGIFGAVAAGLYPDVAAAQTVLASKFSKTFTPNAANVAKYQQVYRQYLQLAQNIETQLRTL